ncbi:MAG: hypothetical protein GF313_01060 [Caldithrix sp.]|nr:hypothetical protein [Caldithrix sp.]
MDKNKKDSIKFQNENFIHEIYYYFKKVGLPIPVDLPPYEGKIEEKKLPDDPPKDNVPPASDLPPSGDD